MSGLLSLCHDCAVLKEGYSVDRRLAELEDRVKALVADTEGEAVRSRASLQQVADAALLETGFTGIYWSTSGGSTGLPANFPCAQYENKLMRALVARMLVMLEVVEKTDIVMSVFSSSNLYRSMEIFQDFFESIGATYLPVGGNGETHVKRSAFSKFQPNVVCGAASSLVNLGHDLITHAKESGGGEGSLPKMRKLMHGGEAVTKSMQECIDTAFSPTLVYSFFGSAETGVWAVHLPSCPPGVYLYDRRLVHLEFMKGDGSMCEEGEEGGDLIVTNLLRYRFPVVRYHSGDKGRAEKVKSEWLPPSFPQLEAKHLSAFLFEGRNGQSIAMGPLFFTVDFLIDKVEKGAALNGVKVLRVQFVATDNTCVVRIVFDDVGDGVDAATVVDAAVTHIQAELTSLLARAPHASFSVKSCSLADLTSSISSQKIPVLVRM
uniref:AMP-dependent synthetase/ligase domain-containing protein n=1 Tax=Palpitomonas bilix TaxID=652834 RepID=A0A7S3G3T9_9EUKA|mmetsp:Transcript_23946/g.60644  ORF Transcript_23946/g.60644 Transcript_23946/m.60644 type:complete len:434 (+) Transcript_23946:251-1552(+)